MDGDGLDAGHCGGVDCDDCNVSASTGGTDYLDADGDSYGSLSSVTSCSLPSGYVTTSGDCNDTDAAIYPGASEYCNSIDDDCDGTTDEDSAVDALTWYADSDGDGFGDASSTTLSCDQPTGFGTDATDCDDTDSAVNPGASETADGVDEDCDGIIDDGRFDNDVDGVLASAGDCDDDDGDGWASPAGVEVCDGIDNNCDGRVDEDLECTEDPLAEDTGGSTSKGHGGGCSTTGGSGDYG